MSKKLILIIPIIAYVAVFQFLAFQSVDARVVYPPGALLQPGDVTTKTILNGTILGEDMTQSGNFYLNTISGNFGIGTSQPQQKLTISAGSNFAVEMAPPTGGGTATTTGGTLPAGVYYFKVVASDGLGTTIGSSQFGRTILTGEAISISWTAVAGAASYRVYGNTLDNQNHYFTDTASPYVYTTTTGSTAGSVPTTTTAYFNKLAASGNSWLSGGNFGIGTSQPNNLLQVKNLINFNNALEGTLLGYEAGKVNTGSANTLVGYQAGIDITSGYSNTALGAYSLGAVIGGLQNTGIGYGAGYSISSGNNNILLGYQTAGNLTTGSNNIMIGHDISAGVATGNYQLNIGNAIYGNLSSGNVGIGTSTPSSKFQVFSTATTTLSVASNSATQGGCLEIRDRDGAGFTYITTLDGVMTASMTSCK